MHCAIGFVGAAISRPRATIGRPYIHTVMLCICFHDEQQYIEVYGCFVSTNCCP